MLSNTNNPPVGVSSILGWLTFAGAELTTIITAATGSQADLNGPGKWTAILGIVSLGITSSGRYLQSHALIRTGGTAAQVIDDGGAALAALSAQAQENVAKVAASPDGVDSGAVPFSGASTTGA